MQQIARDIGRNRIEETRHKNYAGKIDTRSYAGLPYLVDDDWAAIDDREKCKQRAEQRYRP